MFSEFVAHHIISWNLWPSQSLDCHLISIFEGFWRRMYTNTTCTHCKNWNKIISCAFQISLQKFFTGLPQTWGKEWMHSTLNTVDSSKTYKGSGLLLNSESDLVLKYDSRPSSDFLAIIWCIDTPLFLCNTQFYFPLSLLLLHKLCEHVFVQFTVIAQSVAWMPTLWMIRVLFPMSSFLITESGCGGDKMSLIFHVKQWLLLFMVIVSRLTSQADIVRTLEKVAHSLQSSKH
jgi:hypothetical protein